MSRYFTNVKNTIEERVNTSYIDTLYTKDEQGEFRKIVAGESGGGDIELPTYLKEDTIEFNTTLTGVVPNIISKSGSRSSLIAANAFRLSANTSPASVTNHMAMSVEQLRFTGDAVFDITDYRNKKIQTSLVGGDTKTLNLPDIMDSQANYLKPDKIEFANGSGLSADGLSYKIGDMVYTKTIREIAEMAQPYIREMGIDFRPPGDNDSMHITNINDSTVNTNTLALAAQYTDPEYENAYHQTMIDALQFKYNDPETGLIYAANKDVINVTNNLKGLTVDADQINDAVASGGVELPSYIQPTKIDITDDILNYPIYIRGNGSDYYARLKSSALEVMRTDNNTYSSLSNSTLRLYRTDGGASSYTSSTIGFKPPGETYFTAALVEDVVSVVNNLKDLESTAAEIDAAVINSGGTTYPYLKTNSVEIDTTGDTTTSFRSIGPVTHTQITSKAFRAYKNTGFNSAFSNTTIDGNGMTIKGSTATSYTEYLNNEIWVIDGSQSFDASVRDIITSTNKIKAVTASATDMNVSHIRYNSAGTGPDSSIRFHTSTSGMTYANTIKIPRTPGKYAIRLSGAWGSIGVGSSKDFYFMGSNDFITVDAMISQNSDSEGRLIVTPIMKSGSISGGDGHFSCKFELHNANSGSNWELDGTFLVFTNHGLLMDADTWTLE